MCFLLVLSSSTLRQELVRELGIAAPAPTPEGKKPSKKEAKGLKRYQKQAQDDLFQGLFGN